MKLLSPRKPLTTLLAAVLLSALNPLIVSSLLLPVVAVAQTQPQACPLPPPSPPDPPAPSLPSPSPVPTPSPPGQPSAGTPNLVVSALSTPNTDASWGQAIEVTWTVTNRGDQPLKAGWIDRVYLSEDSTPGSDIEIGWAFRGAPLAPGTSYTVTQTFFVSSAFIDKPYILLVTDDLEQQAETNENDNVAALRALAPPDLVIQSASAPGFKFGDTTPVTWTVKNQSDRRANLNWYDCVAYLSPDAVWDKSDDPLGISGCLTTRPDAGKAPLAAGASYTNTRTIYIGIPIDKPPYNGTAYLFIKTDDLDQQIETNENNNVTVVGVGAATSSNLTDAKLTQLYENKLIEVEVMQAPVAEEKLVKTKKLETSNP